MFKKVSIIGFGLIGSSIARALRKNNPAQEIVCGDISDDVCKKVTELGLADSAFTDIAAAVKDADLVVLAMPVGACGTVAEKISGSLSKDAIVTDVGSVKKAVIDFVMPYIPPHAVFVPAHPIAGTENSGPEAGFAELFAGRWCIITPLPGTPAPAVEKISAMWKEFGSQVEMMEPSHHDLVLAITSHLPHLIAYSIVDTATILEEDIKSKVIKYSASGFRDFTRLAASDPVMWRDIFLNNRGAVLEILQRFNEDLTALQKAIRTGNGDLLQDVFTRTRGIRRAIIQAKQADMPAKENKA